MTRQARPWVRWLLAVFAGVLLAALLAVTWLVTTEAGLRRAVTFAESLGTVTIRLEGARGRLIGPLHIDAIELEHPRASIRVSGFEADYEPLEILAGRISAEGVSIAQAQVTLRPPAGPARPPSFMPGWLSLVLDDATVAHLSIVSPAGTETLFRDIRGSAKLSHTRIEFDGVHLRSTGWAVADAGGTLFAREPLALDAHTAWSLDGGRASGIVHASGDLDRLLVDARTALPAVTQVKVEVMDVSAAIRWRGVAEIEKLDLTQWMESPPVGPLAGTLQFEGDLARHAAQGVVRGAGLPAAGLRLDAKLRHADREVHVDSLVLESAPGLAVRARGSMTFGDEPAYSVAADWTNLRWPFAGKALLVSPQGKSHRGRLDRLHLAPERRFPACCRAAARGRSRRSLHRRCN